MPFYKYRCTNDDCTREAFTRRIPSSRRGTAPCPACARLGERVVTAPASVYHPTHSERKDQ